MGDPLSVWHSVPLRNYLPYPGASSKAGLLISRIFLEHVSAGTRLEYWLVLDSVDTEVVEVAGILSPVRLEGPGRCPGGAMMMIRFRVGIKVLCLPKQ